MVKFGDSFIRLGSTLDKCAYCGICIQRGWENVFMRITVKAFGPEITALIPRRKVIDMELGSTVEDLINLLEEEIKAEHSLDLLRLEAPLFILVNGLNHEAIRQKLLNENDVVAIISPIGGG